MKALILALLLASCARPAAGLRVRSPDAQDNAAVFVGTACVEKGEIVILGASGVAYGEHAVITAYHAVKCFSPTIIVRDVHGRLLPAYLDTAWPTVDLALLRVGFGPRMQVEIGSPRVGASVCLAPATPVRNRSCGVVEALRGREIDITNQVERGNSGSGLYDEEGRLVGIIIETRYEAGGVAVALPGVTL